MIKTMKKTLNNIGVALYNGAVHTVNAASTAAYYGGYGACKAVEIPLTGISKATGAMARPTRKGADVCKDLALMTAPERAQARLEAAHRRLMRAQEKAAIARERADAATARAEARAAAKEERASQKEVRKAEQGVASVMPEDNICGAVPIPHPVV